MVDNNNGPSGGPVHVTHWGVQIGKVVFFKGFKGLLPQTPQ
jgi:hypothetical protein